MLGFYKLIMYGGFIVFGIWLVWAIIKSNLLARSEYKLKMTVRDFNIKQIRNSIKKMDITKEELFDDL